MTGSNRPPSPAARLLTEAATLLDAVARDTAALPTACLLSCLLAVEHLEQAGGFPQATGTPPADPAAAIRAALSSLGALPEADFRADDVLDAARAARRALRTLE